MQDEEYAIGIDLGTTFSVAAVLRDDKVEIIPNEITGNTTPSVVSFVENGILVGEQTLNQFIKNPKKTIYSIKRLMGKNYDDKEVIDDIKSNFWTYDVVKQKSGNRPMIKIDNENGKTDYYFPEQISKFILEKIVESARNYLKQPVRKAVITVPAYFNDAQRNATKLSAIQAGLEVLRIINEPTAASLAYGLDKKLPKKEKLRLTTISNYGDSLPAPLGSIYIENEEEIDQDDEEKLIIVFDLGGGTFDVTLLEIEDQEVFDIIATSGDSHLGGDDFDKRIMDYCLKVFSNRLNIPENEIRKDTKAINRLRIACEKAKRKLSYDEEAIIEIDDFYNKELLYYKLKREMFENICQDLFNKLIGPIDKVLELSNKTTSDIKEIVFVGGSTRIPKIKEMIHNYFFDVNINDSINPDEAVAYGAAIQAAKLMKQGTDILNNVILMDITPFSLGTDIRNDSPNIEIKNKGLLMSVIIPKGTKLPFKNMQRYETVNDNQEMVKIGIYEGEKKYIKDNHLQGEFTLTNLPKRPKGQVKVEVTFSIDENGILTVTAEETSQGIKNTIQIVNDKGLNVNEIIKEINISNMSLISIDNENEVKNYKKCINDYIKYYAESYNNEEKYKYIQNLSKILIKFIDTFDKIGNDTLGNKYFLYIKALFETYRKRLQLLSAFTDDNLEEIPQICKKFLQILSTFKNTDYKSYIELLYLFDIPLSKNDKKETIKIQNKITELRERILFDLVTYVIELIEEKAEKILSSVDLKLSKYNSKYLFQNCIQISELFIKSERDLAKYYQIRERHNNCLENCKNKIKEINANSLFEIDRTKQSGILFDNGENIEREELLIILDNYREALHNMIEINDNEYKAILLANIVKINYEYLKNDNYVGLKKMAEESLSLAKTINKNLKELKWYQEISQILEELRKKSENMEKMAQDNFEKKCKNEKKYIFDEIENYRKKSNIEFIEFILEKYPPKINPLRKNKTAQEEFNHNKKRFIQKLFQRYHPDNLGLLKNTDEEKLKYSIYHTISLELNSINNALNPSNIILEE